MKLANLWRRRKSVIVAWCTSYVVVVFFPVLMSVVMYREAHTNLKSEISRASDALLQQARGTIDAQIERMQRMSTEVTWNLNVQDLFYSNKTDNEAMYTAYRIAKEFNIFRTSYTSIGDFYVTWDKQQNVIIPGSIKDFGVAFDSLHNTGAMTYKQWEDTVVHADNKRFMVLPRVGADKPYESLALVTHMPGKINGASPGSVVIMSDISWFQKAAESILGFNGGQLFILDEDNRVLIANPGAVPSEAMLKLLEDIDAAAADSSPSFTTAGDNSEMFYLPSKVSGLKYVSVIPGQIFWQKAEYVRRFTTVSILCSVAGAALLTFFFMRRNYSPIRQLVQTLSGEHKDQKPGSPVNELGFIQHAVAHALSEKEKISLQLQKQSLIVRSNTLNRLLKGKADPLVPFDEAFLRFNIHFETEDFAVIVFYAEEPEEEEALGYGEKELQRIITGVLEELLAARLHAGYTTEMDEMMACIVSFSEEGRTNREEELQEILAEAKLMVLESCGVKLALACSGIHQGLEGIAAAYQEAMDAMEYRMVMGKPEIIFSHVMQREGAAEDHLGYYYPLEVERQLINFIKVGDFGKARTVLDEIADRNFNKPMASITVARCVMFNMISTMIKTMNEIGGMEESFLLKNPRWMEQITASRTIKEMYEQLLLLLKEVCLYASSQIASQVTQVKAESMRGMIGEVTRFIHEHYQDYNLNVNMIGKEFQIKPSYLSQMFKNITGEGMLDYIGQYRVLKSKEIIREQQLSIAEIARLAGFTETATFIRVFKKHEGITPGKYKEMELLKNSGGSPL